MARRRLAIALAILVAIPVCLWLVYPMLGVLEGTRLAADDAASIRRHIPAGWTVGYGLARVARSGTFGMTLTVTYPFKAVSTDYPQLSQEWTHTYAYPYREVWWDAETWASAFPRSFGKLPPARRSALASYIVGLGSPSVWDARSLTGSLTQLEYLWGGGGEAAAALQIGRHRGYQPADLLWIEPYLRGPNSWRSAQLLGWDSATQRWILLAHQVHEFESPLIQD